MARLGLAFRAFWRVLREEPVAEQVERVLEGGTPALPTAPAPPAPSAPPPSKPAPTRSDAISLLAALQREGRLVDFLKEDIAGYSDAQVGAAVRDVHAGASAVLERMFALGPLMTQSEGQTVEVPTGADAGRVRLVGNVSGNGPYRGVLQHAGWEATKLDLPEWSGTQAAARVVAPAEVEVR